jgi:hypothetical protein
MTIETEVANLTAQTTALLSAVNVSKTTLDQKVTDATTQVTLATEQATLATTKATAASSSQAAAASSADASEAARAAAVVAQNNAVSVVTGGTASLTAAASKIPVSDAASVLDPSWLENNQTFQRLVGAIAYATDLAGHAAGSPLVLAKATPSGTTVGNPGNVAFDSSYLYICTAKNVWKRVALTSF